MLLFTLLSMLWKYVTVLSFLITVFFPLAAALLSVFLPEFHCVVARTDFVLSSCSSPVLRRFSV